MRKTSDGVGDGIALDNFAPGDNGRTGMGAIPSGSDLVLPVRPIPFEVTVGEHVLKLAPRESMYVDLVAVTDNPGLFD